MALAEALAQFTIMYTLFHGMVAMLVLVFLPDQDRADAADLVSAELDRWG